MNNRLKNEVSVRKNWNLYLAPDLYQKVGAPSFFKVMVDVKKKIVVLYPTNMPGKDSIRIVGLVQKYKIPYLNFKSVFKILQFSKPPKGRKQVRVLNNNIIVRF